VRNQIGYPQQFLNYTGLVVSKNQWFETFLSAASWNFQFMANQIQKPSQKDLWEMTPDQVNAYYEPTKNEMVFPAGILQTPFFDASFPLALNYGGIGMVMGHELTHGFDNQGRNYDGNGYLVDWWQPSSGQKFDQLVSCVIQQYSKFEVLPNVFINGNLTQGENIADMGGVKNSYNALKTILGDAQMNSPSIVPGLTNAKLFFVGFAQGWCAVQSPEYVKLQVAIDPHSPAKYRVLGPLINHPNFASVFSCPVGSHMNPINKCAVW